MPKVEIKGLSQAISNPLSEDGETMYLVNLRKKDGSLQPVTQGKEIGTLDNFYDLIYIHSTNFIENWIGIKDNGIYTNINTKAKAVTKLNATIRQLQSIGNTLILITDEGLFYLLFHDSQYKILGNKPPFPYCNRIVCNTRKVTSDFTSIEGNITDAQAAMEAMLIKNRWKEDAGYLLCGAYLVCYALKLFDGSHILHSSPLLVFPTQQFKHPYIATLAYDGDRFIPESSTVESVLFDIEMEFSTTGLSNWSDIVTGIDVFISPELGVITETFKKINNSIIATSGNKKIVRPCDTEYNTLIHNIDNMDNFYLIKSLSLNSNTHTVTFPEKSIGTMQNIVHQTTLEIDSYSHHDITADYAYTYNQRLHIANIETYFTKGFDIRAYCPGRTPTGLQPIAEVPNVQSFTQKQIPQTYIQIYIDNNETTDSYLLSSNKDITYFYLNPFFSYPDPRAKKAVITFCNASNHILQKITLELKPHSNLNIAYYVDKSLKEITLPISADTYFNDQSKPAIKINEENKLKVSALQNPFTFPNENTYIASNGKILGMATNTTPVSEGQFGQYPLYVFAEDGIYILANGSGSTVYSNVAPISEEIAIPSTIKPVVGAVFFLTLKGAYLITGSQTLPIAQQLNADRPIQNMEHYKSIKKLLFPDINIDLYGWLEFIRLSDLNIHFNYIANEILITSNIAGFAYVYNLDSQSWHTTTHLFQAVSNCFPNLYGIVNDKIIDISDETENPATTLLLTRPLKFGNQYYKTLHRQILRSYIHIPPGNEAGFFTFASNDAHNFRLKTNIRLKHGKYKDIDSGLITSSKYKYFALLFAAVLEKDSRIEYTDSTIYPTNQNDKLR